MKNDNFTWIKNLVLLTLVFGLFSTVTGATWKGSGTIADPYQISDAVDFDSLRYDNTGKYFRLTNDIDMSSYDKPTNPFYPIMKVSTPWKGHLNGAGFKVSNIDVVRNPLTNSNNYKYVGVFGVVGLGVGAANTSSIDSVGFDNITIDMSSPSATVEYVGVIGRIVNSGLKISNSYVTNATIKGGTKGTGGLVGIALSATANEMTNCYVDATIEGGRFAGGFLGEDEKANTVISNCAFYGSVSAPTKTRPIVVPVKTGIYTNNYYKVNTDTYAPTPVAGTGLNAIAIKDLASYVGFSPIWKMGGNYAILNYVTQVAAVTSNITYENTGSFDPNNPSTYTNEVSVTLNTLVNDSADRVFEGWYRDVALTNKVNGVAIASGTVGDTTFYAKWVISETYNITYMNMGTVTNTNPLTYTNVEEVTLVAPGDSAGYDWLGWYEDALFATPVSSPAIAVGGSSDRTFYGKWQQAPFASGGDGSVGNPYLVASVFDVQSMHLDGYAHYKFTADIDMDGQSFTPIAALFGSIDGDKHVLSNLTIAGRGFVVELKGGASIMSLGIENLSVTGSQGVGGIIGFMYGGGSNRLIENCYVKGATITCTNGPAGGIAGWCWSGVTGGVTNTIRNCFVDAEISGSDQVGGITGRTYLTTPLNIDSCAFYGSLDTTVTEFGPIRGNIWSGSDTVPGSNMYYVDSLVSSKMVDQGNAVAVPKASMTKKASFPNLDFTSTWKMGNDYPVLSWVVEGVGVATKVKSTNELALHVYPNPTTGVLTVAIAKQSDLIIFNLNGAIVLQQTLRAGENMLDVSALESGLYMLTVNGEASSKTVKFQIK